MRTATSPPAALMGSLKSLNHEVALNPDATGADDTDPTIAS